MKKIILILSFAALGAACKKTAPPPAAAPKAQAEELSGDAAVAGSTAPGGAGAFLNAPGNYIRNTVGQIDKAKAAKALFEDTAKEQAKSLDLNETNEK